MRICYVAFQFWPGVGGSQAQAEKQARYLRQLGQEVLIVTLRHQRAWPARETYAALPVVRVGGWYRRGGTLRAGRFGHLIIDVLLFLMLWRLRGDYDLIHTLQLSPLAMVATLIGKLTHKPVILGIQSTGPCERSPACSAREIEIANVAGGSGQEPTAAANGQAEVGGDVAGLQRTVWGGRWMLNYLRRSDAYYQILSSRSYLYLMQHGFRPERIIYIPNGVDIQQFYPPDPVWSATMEQGEDRPILCVARMEYAKGIDILLRAWAYLLAMSSDWRRTLHPRLLLVGDGARRAELEQLAAALGIRENVEFLGTRRDILHLLHEAWGFVLPSRWEGMPNALLEAMACALPCVATRVSGSEDVIEQGVNGLLVEPERPQQLAYALRLLIEDVQLARRLGWQGHETISHYYQLGFTAQNCLTFYRYLLTRDNAQHRPTGSLQGDDLSPEEWQRYGE